MPTLFQVIIYVVYILMYDSRMMSLIYYPGIWAGKEGADCTMLLTCTSQILFYSVPHHTLSPKE